MTTFDGIATPADRRNNVAAGWRSKSQRFVSSPRSFSARRLPSTREDPGAESLPTQRIRPGRLVILAGLTIDPRASVFQFPQAYVQRRNHALLLELTEPPTELAAACPPRSREPSCPRFRRSRPGSLLAAVSPRHRSNDFAGITATRSPITNSRRLILFPRRGSSPFVAWSRVAFEDLGLSAASAGDGRCDRTPTQLGAARLDSRGMTPMAWSVSTHRGSPRSPRGLCHQRLWLRQDLAPSPKPVAATIIRPAGPIPETRPLRPTPDADGGDSPAHSCRPRGALRRADFYVLRLRGTVETSPF